MQPHPVYTPPLLLFPPLFSLYSAYLLHHPHLLRRVHHLYLDVVTVLDVLLDEHATVTEAADGFRRRPLEAVLHPLGIWAPLTAQRPLDEKFHRMSECFLQNIRNSNKIIEIASKLIYALTFRRLSSASLRHAFSILALGLAIWKLAVIAARCRATWVSEFHAKMNTHSAVKLFRRGPHLQSTRYVYMKCSFVTVWCYPGDRACAAQKICS